MRVLALASVSGAGRPAHGRGPAARGQIGGLGRSRRRYLDPEDIEHITITPTPTQQTA